MKRPPKMRTPDHTRLNLGQDKYYRPFINGYIKLLQSKLKKVEHIGHKYRYMAYTCGEPHDERNPNWRPFGLLWKYCERTGPIIDPFKEIIVIILLLLFHIIYVPRLIYVTNFVDN